MHARKFQSIEPTSSLSAPSSFNSEAKLRLPLAPVNQQDGHCALLTPPALAADLVIRAHFSTNHSIERRVPRGKPQPCARNAAYRFTLASLPLIRASRSEDGTYTQTMSIDLNEAFTKGAAPYYRLFRGKPGTAGSQAFSGYQTVGWQRSKSPYNPLKPFMKGRHSLQHTASYDGITEAQYDAYVKPYMEQPSGYYLVIYYPGLRPAMQGRGSVG
ncbi:unnamed protein product [Closterium sp. NIES-65]|nr:unnamed protein product [Closterium sp. NIES-65]